METPNLDKARKEVAEDLVLRFRRDASALGLKATGALDKSFGYKLVADQIEIFAEKYASALNTGTGPAKTNDRASGKFQRFKIWAKAKGLRPLTTNKYGNKTFAKYKNNESVYDSMVWAMMKKVSKQGITKRPKNSQLGFIDKIVQEQKEDIKVIFTEAYKQDLIMDIKSLKLK